MVIKILDVQTDIKGPEMLFFTVTKIFFYSIVGLFVFILNHSFLVQVFGYYYSEFWT